LPFDYVITLRNTWISSIFQFRWRRTFFFYDFRLPPRFKWGLRSSGLLRSLDC